MKKVILFDLDGTLFFTLQDLTNSVNYALNNAGYPPITLEDTRLFIGHGIKELLRKSLKGNEYSIEKMMQWFIEFYQANLNDTTHLYDGMYEVVLELHKRGYKLGIVSNKYQDGVNRICIPVFGPIMSIYLGENKEMQRKPSTEMLEYACKQLECTLQECIYIGDSEVDVNTCIPNHIDFIGAAWGYRGEKALQKLGVQNIAKNPKDLLERIVNFS